MTGNIRVGIGYDVHPLIADRELVLGGIPIPFVRGLEGWSDGDVLTHAVIEALLGAAALGDIGRHFPPGDPQYKGISSLILLGEVKEMLDNKSWRIGNIDVTVVTEEPKLKDYIDKMRKTLGETLDSGFEQISIKASTNNGLGAIGRNEGIAAYAVVLIEATK